MSRSRKKHSVVSVQNPLLQIQEVVGEILSEQHMSPLPNPLGTVSVRGCDASDDILMFHWTVRMRVIAMTEKEISILIKVMVVDILIYGCDLSGYLSLEYLVNRLSRGKTDLLEIREEKDRQAAMLGNLILSWIRGNWINLGEKELIPEEVVKEIEATGWLPDRRTFGSWKIYYNVRTFLEVSAVPLENFIDLPERTTIRYSGYTKGYGNGGHVSRTKKTPYDSETDGEDTDRDPPSFSLQDLDKYNSLLFSIEKAKVRKVQES